ncbi:MAG: hypothetical protein ACXWNK_06115 [Vulcanimicrobiaceae bacterium]
MDRDIEHANKSGDDDEVEREIESEDDGRVMIGEEPIEREEIDEND